MRLFAFIVFLLVNLQYNSCNAQVVPNGPGTFVWVNAAPTFNPGAWGAKFAVNVNTYEWYEWVGGVSWVASGDRIQKILGCTAPAYIPGNHNSLIVRNECTPVPELYAWTGTAWVKLNGGGSLTWPLQAPISTTPNYSFEDATGTGMFYNDDIIPILSIKGQDDIGSYTGVGIEIISGRGSAGGQLTMRGGEATEAEERGGTFLLEGGPSTGDDGEGGQVFMKGGPGTIGGTVVVQGGPGTSGAGGVDIFTGDAPNLGGQINIRTTPSTSGNIGDLTIQTGLTGLAKPVIFNSAGLQYKGLTTAQRDALTGLTGGRVIWNSTLSKLQVYNGSTWENLH